MPAYLNRSADPTALVLARLLLDHLQNAEADEHRERLAAALDAWLYHQQVG